MCLFTACAQGYHNSSKLHPHPHAALSSLPFLPLFVFNPTFHFSLPLFQLFFSPTVFTPVFISHALIAVLFLPHFSSHSSLPSLFSIQITHLHFNTPPPPDRFASSLSFPPRASIPPSWKATDQGRNGLITVWCAFAWLHATELSSVRLLINDLCFYWYMSDTSKESDSPS